MPAYKRIMEHIRSEMKSGKYAPGDRIPSENEIARMFGVSRLTARRAIEKLADEGLLIRIPGLGTFVSDISRVEEEKMVYVGVAIDDMMDARGRAMIFGIMETLRNFSVYALLSSANSKGGEFLIKKLKEFLKEGVKGLIISPFLHLVKSGILDVYRSRGIPVVFIDRNVKGFYTDFPTVESDNRLGGKLLGEHLRKKHHVENALFVTSEGFEISSVLNRYEGFKEGLLRDVDHLVGNIDEIKKELPKVLKRKKYDAIFFCHDLLAITGLTVILREGLRIPEDIRVVSFDDRILSKFPCPRLTTVRQDFEEMGKTAALLLVKLMKGEDVPFETRIPVELVVRESCGCRP